MEKIRIGKEERRYEINGIQPESANVLKIAFADTIPDIWGDITIHTRLPPCTAMIRSGSRTEIQCGYPMTEVFIHP